MVTICAPDVATLKQRTFNYEVGSETGAPLATADLTRHGFARNVYTVGLTLMSATCERDCGSQVVTVKNGATSLFTITGVYSINYSTTDGSTGYITAASMRRQPSQSTTG
jgi:hypothetical protein